MSKWACVARFGSTGDNLLASSVLPLLKEQGYMIEVMAAPPAHAVFENNPYIDKLTVISMDDLPKNNAEWHQYWSKRAREYDKFCALSYSIEGHIAFHPDTAPFWWPDSYRRRVCDRSYLALTHDLCDLPHEFAPNFFPTDAETEQAAERKIKSAPQGQPVVGWVMAGSRIDKMYPYAPSAIGRLIKELGVAVIAFGALNQREWEGAKTIQESVRVANSTIAGFNLAMGRGPAGEQTELPLRESMALLRQCDLVVSPDTGLAWSVAMQPMPKLILLGHASARNITFGWVNTTALSADPARVPCAPCHRLHNDATTCRLNKEGNGAACVSDISVERIVRLVRKGLEHASGSVHQSGAGVLA